MRHNVFRRKIKSSLILLVAGVILVSTLLASSLGIHQAHAADSMSADQSAKIKIIFQALTSCLRTTTNSTAKNPKSEFKIDAPNIQSDHIRGAYIESMIDTTNDTQSNCGHLLSNGKLTDVLKEAGITKAQFYCDYNNTANYGILVPKSGVACSDAINNSDSSISLKNADEVRNYLENLFKNKAFNGNVPGNNLYKLTALEKYYAYKTAFTTFCIEASTSAHFGDTSFTGYKTYVQNPSTGRVELATYSINNSRKDSLDRVWEYYNSTEGLVYNERYTCSQVAEMILGNINSEEVQARAGDQISSDKKDCNNAYDAQYNTIRDWVSSNGNSFNNNAESDISIFLSENARNNADKWKLESDGITVTCTGLNTLNSKWEDIKRRHGLDNAPSVNTNVTYTTHGEIENTDQGTGVSSTCHAATKGLGWILCPVLEAVASAASWAYEDVITPMLGISPKLLQVEGANNGTYKAWIIFRDIANVAFAIFFLFIIFSQVTGFGIDNYGIKKSLPKLIVSAILINLSFYICQGLVDISNIVGSGLYGAVNSIASEITIPVGNVFSSDVGSITFAIIGAIGVGAVGTLVAGAAFWGAIASALFALIPVVISAVVAILMFFVLLAMRQAVVVVLVAISPLAFVAYALPNTKRLFDRWSEILRGMLLLYPISALLMSFGRLASRIIFATGAGDLGGGSWVMVIIAMAAEILPLFLIPSVTRSAYRATGALGASIGRLSTMASRGARSGVRNSRTYQNTSERVRGFRARQRTERHGALYGRVLNGIRSSATAVENEENGGQAATRRQRILAYLGRDRAANINKAASEAGAKEGEKRAWATGNPEEIMEGARNRASIDAQQQMVNVADYANATFANAVIKQQRQEHDDRTKRQVMWNSDKYANGKANEALLARQADAARMTLSSRAEYFEARQNAQKAVISNEITKMYSDQASRMDMKNIMEMLKGSISGNDDKNRSERFTAAASALIQAGQADKVREVISGGGDYSGTGVEDAFGELIKNDSTFRNRVTQVLGSSGEFTFQEYAKHVGQSKVEEGKSEARSFQAWADGRLEDGKGQSLADSIKTKGLDRIDKDGFDFLSKHLSALDGASAENISRVAARTTDAATAGKLVQAIERLAENPAYSDKIADIISATSAERAADMNVEVRNALAGIKSTDSPAEIYAKNQVWRDQIGDAIRTNPQIAARFASEFTNERGGQYYKPAPTPAPTPTPNPEPQPQPPRPQSD